MWCATSALCATILGFSTTVPADKVIYVIRHGEKVDGNAEEGQLNKYNQCLSQQGWMRAYNLKSVFGAAPVAPFRTPDYIFSANYQEPLECRDTNGFYRTQQTVSALADDAAGGLGLRIDNTTGFMPSLCGLKWNPAAVEPYGQLRTSQPEPWKYLALDWAKAQPQDPSSACFPYNEGVHEEDVTIAHHFKTETGSYTAKKSTLKTSTDQLGSGMCCNAAAAKKMLAKLAEPGINTILVAWESANTYWLAQALGVPKDELSQWKSSNYDSVYVLKYDRHAKRLTDFDLTSFYQGFDYPEPGPHERHHLGPNSFCGAIEKTDYPWAFPLPNVISPTDNDNDGVPEYILNRAL